MQMLRVLVVALLLALVLAACGGGPAASPGNEYGASGGDTTAPSDGVDRSRLSRQLFFYNWSDYIDPAVLEQFEAEYGVRVVVDTYDSNEDMLAKVRAGNSGYDIVVPSDYAVQIMIAEGWLRQLIRRCCPTLSILILTCSISISIKVMSTRSRICTALLASPITPNSSPTGSIVGRRYSNRAKWRHSPASLACLTTRARRREPRCAILASHSIRPIRRRWRG